MEDLVKLAREKSTASRITLAATLAELFNENNSTLTKAERQLMFDLMRQIVREAESSVRRTLASYLSVSEDVPADLIKTLANDDIEVAFPVLTESGVLKDMDLVEVVRSRTFQHQLAVALRENIGTVVTDALVDTGNAEVIQAALENESARFSDETLERVSEISKKEDRLQRPVLSRPDLPPELAKRMFMWVSVALRHFIVRKYEYDAAEIDALLERAALEELDRYSQAYRAGSEDRASEGVATAGMMVEALQEGNVPRFVQLFCKASRLRGNLVMRLLMEPGGEGLAVACKGLGFSRSFFSTLYDLSRKSVPGAALSAKQASAAASQALVFYDSVNIDQCKKLLERWRLDSGYLNALRHFEGLSGSV